MKSLAVANGLVVSERVADVVDAGVELGVVVAFGRLVKPDVLERVPMVNVHFSLLPRWRGAAPVERAILAGDEVTGVSLMQLEEGLDTGPVFLRQVTPIGPEETAPELRARLGAIGTEMLLELLERWPDAPVPEAQEGVPSYAAKLTPEELRLDWTRPAAELARIVRVGRAWTTFRGRRLLVHRARCAELPSTAGEPGALAPGTLLGRVVAAGDPAAADKVGLELIEVQPEGRAVQRAEDWLRGARPAAGERLGS